MDAAYDSHPTMRHNRRRFSISIKDITICADTTLQVIENVFNENVNTKLNNVFNKILVCRIQGEGF